MSLRQPTTEARLTQGFGYTGFERNGPFRDNRTGVYYPVGFHTGLDLAAPVGTRLYAPEHGMVFTASWEAEDPSPDLGKWAYGGGNVVILRHNNTPFFTTFAHLDTMHVRTGQPVYKGQLIGEIGATGNVTGPHTHFSCWFNSLWYTVLDAYVEDPHKFYAGGEFAGQRRIKPTRVKIGPDVNIRSRPKLASRVRGGKPTSRTRLYPYVRDVSGEKLTIGGVTSNQWAQIRYKGWSYVWKPLVLDTVG